MPSRFRPKRREDPLAVERLDALATRAGGDQAEDLEADVRVVVLRARSVSNGWKAASLIQRRGENSVVGFCSSAARDAEELRLQHRVGHTREKGARDLSTTSLLSISPLVCDQQLRDRDPVAVGEQAREPALDRVCQPQRPVLGELVDQQSRSRSSTRSRAASARPAASPRRSRRSRRLRRPSQLSAGSLT